MHLIKNNLINCETEPYSPVSYKKVTPNKRFMPFQRERDSMNRLLSAHSPRKKQNASQQLQRNDDKTRKKGKSRHFHKLNQYFKEQNVFAETQNKKNRQSKKSIVHLIVEHEQKKRPSTHHGKRESITRPSTGQSTSFKQFRKTQSLQLSKAPSQPNPTIKRVSSSVITRQPNLITPKKENSPEQSPKKSTYYQPKISIEQNMNKYPQLNRVRRTQQLSVKMFPDFQKNHNLFLQKMIQSKQLAFEVKMNLMRLDECY